MYSTILAALDGSDDSLAGGRMGLDIARHSGSRLLATHVYDADIHTSRFREMEPGLPAEYQQKDTLEHLRDSHDGLITHGFQALSRGYMQAFLGEARDSGVAASEVVAEGRNYVALLRLARERQADLIVLGAHGIGAIGDHQLGSTAARVLRRAPCDVLVARQRGPGPVLAGIDGSDEALAALRKATQWARTLERPLHVAAAYDTAFHQQVFQVMARSLSAEQQAQVGLDKQKGLHRKFIDEGLRKLYQAFLGRAGEVLEALSVEAERSLVQGKAYRALLDHAGQIGAALIVVGRFGHHRESGNDIGSNAEAVARLSAASVLVTAPAEVAPQPGAAERAALEWDDDALARLERVPGFARPMARRGVEEHVRSKGRERVTLADFLDVARRLGMGGDGGEDSG